MRKRGAEEYVYHPNFVPGIVYVWGIEGIGNSEIFNIGRTTAGSSESRRDDCQTGCPFRIFIEAEFYCEDSVGLESYLHEFFDDCRMEGEWFRVRSHRRGVGSSADYIRRQIWKYIDKTDKALWKREA